MRRPAIWPEWPINEAAIELEAYVTVETSIRFRSSFLPATCGGSFRPGLSECPGGVKAVDPRNALFITPAVCSRTALEE
jgi:hypothetical protein